MAHGSMVVSSRNLPPRSPRQRQRLGRSRLVYWKRLDCAPAAYDIPELNEKTLHIFGGVNALSILVVWVLYPETNQRTLEEMNLVFAADSIWNWEAEKNYKILKEENPDLVQAAQRGRSVVDPETGMVRRPSTGGARKVSLSVRKGSQVGENGFAGEKGGVTHQA
jgi:hypothetical protein